MAIVAVSIAPLGTREPGVSPYVAAALRVLERYPNLTYVLDPMFTTIQGDLREVFQAVADMHDAVAEAGSVRISSVIKVDDRRDKEMPMGDKVDKVYRQMGKKP